MNRTPLRLAIAGLTVAALGAVAPLTSSPASAGGNYSTNLLVRATDSNGVQVAGGTTAAKLSSDGNWLGFSKLTANGSYLKSLVSGPRNSSRSTMRTSRPTRLRPCWACTTTAVGCSSPRRPPT